MEERRIEQHSPFYIRVIFPFRRETLQTKLSYNPIGRFLYYHLVSISGDPLFFPIWSNESFTYSTRVVLNAFMALRRLFVEISSIPISSAYLPVLSPCAYIWSGLYLLSLHIEVVGCYVQSF
ncbi:hypothetical protein ABFS83_08G167900 [Erythranthe nasuta]